MQRKVNYSATECVFIIKSPSHFVNKIKNVMYYMNSKEFYFDISYLVISLVDLSRQSRQ